MHTPRLILASASPRRLELLRQIGIEPDDVQPADIDETPHRAELPQHYVARIAAEKGEVVRQKNSQALILAADTVVACGRRILGKPEDEKQARRFLELLSGRRHRVYSSVWIGSGSENQQKTVMTQVKFKCLHRSEIDAYLASGEWEDKAGGYAIQGLAASFIPSINGSYSNVVGLPLMETKSLISRFI